MIVMKPAISIFILILLAGCSGEGRYYDCESGEKDCMTLPVVLGSEKNSVRISIGAEAHDEPVTAAPIVFVHFDVSPQEIEKLKHLDVRLVVDGREIEADSQEYTAAFLSDVSSAVSFKDKLCCSELGERLAFNFAPEKIRNSDKLKLIVRKDFDSLGRLPDRITLVLTATTDKGTTEMERTVVLRSR